MSIRCGSCRQSHETVAEVKVCYASDAKTHYASGVETRTDGQRPNRFAGKCTMCGRWVEAETGHITKIDGKWHVFCNTGEHLHKKTAPKQVSDRYSDIPAGHYATASPTGHNDLDFWRVDRPTEGQWAGYTFIKRVIGGRPDVPVKVVSAKKAALDAIRAAGPASASQLYGQQLGRCYRCNRHLTDETSRALGIGPDCRSQSPFHVEGEGSAHLTVREARELLEADAAKLN